MEQQLTPEEWVSAHIYYTSNWNEFLVNVISKFIETHIEICSITSYFYIRYSENGPHIRLRLLTSKKDLMEARIKDYFERYFKYNPSVRGGTYKGKLFENNTIQFIKYSPEYERYGGEFGVKVSEQHFCQSTRVILQILSANDFNNYSVIIGKAISLHVSFIYAVGFKCFRCISTFFYGIYKEWIEYNISQLKDNRSYQDKNEFLVSTLEAKYRKSSHGIQNICKTLYEGVNDEREFDEHWLNAWIPHVNLLKEELSTLEFGGILQIPHTKGRKARNPNIAVLYESYIHMNNNRLGILNADESHIAFMLYRAFGDLANEKRRKNH